MKLLREFYEPQSGMIENLIVKDDEGNKNIILRGIFAQAEITNKNGRNYPKPILEREAYNLQKKIATNTLIGELDHPEKPEVLLKNAAIMITSLKQDGNNFIGESKILKTTPQGAVAYALAKEGLKFGISTRGLGSVNEKEGIKYVCEDYQWLTCDLVCDPSAPDAFLQSVMESMEFCIEKDPTTGIAYIKEDTVLTYRNKIRKMSKQEINENIEKMFVDFLKEIK